MQTVVFVEKYSSINNYKIYSKHSHSAPAKQSKILMNKHLVNMSGTVEYKKAKNGLTVAGCLWVTQMIVEHFPYLVKKF